MFPKGRFQYPARIPALLPAKSDRSLSVIRCPVGEIPAGANPSRVAVAIWHGETLDLIGKQSAYWSDWGPLRLDFARQPGTDAKRKG
jgi:hypothetical protein